MFEASLVCARMQQSLEISIIRVTQVCLTLPVQSSFQIMVSKGPGGDLGVTQTGRWEDGQEQGLLSLLLQGKSVNIPDTPLVV